jgi:DNA-binding CsgD family transcriptional regulator
VSSVFLSHRTVGSHLYRIFPKLGIMSRRYLVASFTATTSEAVAAA